MRRDTAAMEINAAQDVAIVYQAKKSFEYYSGGSSEQGMFNPMYEEMRREIIALEEKGIGRDWPLLLPKLEPHRIEVNLQEAERKQREFNKGLRDAEDAARIKREDRAIELKKATLPVPLFRSSQFAPPQPSDEATTDAAPGKVAETTLFPEDATVAASTEELLLQQEVVLNVEPPRTTLPKKAVTRTAAASAADR
jgi:hypothetical protein